MAVIKVSDGDWNRPVKLVFTSDVRVILLELEGSTQSLNSVYG